MAGLVAGGGWVYKRYDPRARWGAEEISAAFLAMVEAASCAAQGGPPAMTRRIARLRRDLHDLAKILTPEARARAVGRRARFPPGPRHSQALTARPASYRSRRPIDMQEVHGWKVTRLGKKMLGGVLDRISSL